MSLLPIPKDWTAARRLLAPFAHAAIRDDKACGSELFVRTLAAYGLSETQMEPLMLWT
jgi:hypothetical protein